MARERNGTSWWRGLQLTMLLVWSGACSETPQVGDSNYYSPQVVHARFTDPCAICHEQQRLGPADGVAHGFGRDCQECHQATDDPAALRPWQPLAFSHVPDPSACLGCHGTDRPARETHPQTGDCVSCHKYPAWLPALISP